jgi:hypothetical protein
MTPVLLHVSLKTTEYLYSVFLINSPIQQEQSGQRTAVVTLTVNVLEVQTQGSGTLCCCNEIIIIYTYLDTRRECNAVVLTQMFYFNTYKLI